MTLVLFDTHTHLNDEDLFERAHELVRRAVDAGVARMVVPGYDLESSRRAVELASRFAEVYAAVGIHPHDAKSATEQDFTTLEEWADHPKVVAIGEIGLDYHYDNSPRESQAEVFRRQIAIARQKGLPIIIHDREAHADVLTIVQESSPLLAGGVMHSYSGSLEMAQTCMRLGFYLSFSGPITFKNAKRPREVAAGLPLDRLLIETDAPYLTPEPFRGKPNEPALVRYVFEKLVELREEEAYVIADAVYQNALRLFQIRE